MTRAQEAEENYVIKRELAVVRQQCTAASESLEKAQDTIRELQQQKVNQAASVSQRRNRQTPPRPRTADEPNSTGHFCVNPNLF